MPEKELRTEEEQIRSRLVNMLREKGIEDKETRDLLVEWRKKEEERAEGEEGQIRLLIKQAEIYKEAGLLAEALEQLNDAAEYAFQARRDDLLEEVDEKIAEIEKIKQDDIL